MAAPPTGTLRVGRYFLALVALLVVLYALVFLPGERHTPKLGLDLEGGAQVIFKAQTQEGGKTPSKSAMDEARQIMENRVNGTGVSNATVVIQGSDQIVVSIPGKKTSDIAQLGQAAQLNFRAVVMPPVAAPSAAATTSPTPTSAPTPTGTSGTRAPTTSAGHPASTPTGSAHAGQADSARPLAAATPTPTPKTTPKPTAKATATAAATATPNSSGKTSPDPLASLKFPIPTTDTEYAKLTSAQQSQLQATMSSFDCASKAYTASAYNNKSVLACDSADPAKATIVYLLGPVIVPGTQIASASAVPPSTSGTGGSIEWTVQLNLKSKGQTAWANYTTAHHSNTNGNIPAVTSCSTTSTPCAEYVAFTLDGAVISAPHNEAAINGQATQISGGFTQQSATLLAQQLKYGALPLNFTTQSIQEVSATLGTAQLKAGLLAGGIGLALVVLYSLIYYRALGLVTIASLLVSGALTWACLVILGREIGFTLTLAGIAGFIVAVGITADSFVVFFERIKDEVHSGKSVRTAVPRAWVRARRTILSADTVSFLAAAVLYEFAAGDVKGFAFTLGLSTILDLVVVFLFTHPMVSLLSRSAAFGSPRFTGLNALRVSTPAAPPAEVAPPRRSASGAERGGAPARAPQPERQTAPVILLDEDADAEELVSPNEPETAVAPVEPHRSGPPAEPEPEPDQEPEPKPRPAPAAGGTAAERAAARRARMRAEATRKKGES